MQCGTKVKLWHTNARSVALLLGFAVAFAIELTGLTVAAALPHPTHYRPAQMATELTGLPAVATSHATSTNIAVVPNFTGSGYGGGNAGTFVTNWFPKYKFTAITPTQVISWTNLIQFDTIVLWQFCNLTNYPAFTSNLVTWLQNTGGKLVIWDADSCPASTYYGWLSPLGAKFDRYSPNGIGGSGGSLTILDNTGLGSADTNSPFYVNARLIALNTDAVNDLTVVNENTISPVWCAEMRGTNGLNQSGFAIMSTQVGGLIGAPDAFIIYSGLDTDSISAPGPLAGGQIATLLGYDLAHGWGPPGTPEVADLTCQAPVGNLVVTPLTATNLVGQVHTVTAHVTIQNPSGGTTNVPGVTVSFAVISGPSAGISGAGTSDANGLTSFSYVGTFPDTDTIQATATVNSVFKTYAVTKLWVSLTSPNLYKNDLASGPVLVGDIISYAISFDTFSNISAAVNLQIVDVLPIEEDFISATTNGALSVVYDPINHGVVWNFPTWPPLSAGLTNILTVRINSNAVGQTSIINFASIISSNLPAATNVDHNPRCPTCVGVLVCPPPALSITPAANRGYYQVGATSDCYSASQLQFYVMDTGSTFVAGPYPSGTVVKIKKSPATGIGPASGPASVTIKVLGNGQIYAVDPAGQISAPVTCLSL